MNPLAHYVQYGWKDLRNPSPRFDTWWYWAKHLDLAQDTVMPLAHYVAEGKGRGLSTRPPRFPSRQWGTGHRFAEGQPVRRVCLFAAYDADGVVDDYVIDYVKELSRFADVYYLADSDMPESELEKLADITVEAWADRHGEYDFGSYKRLAERVGWERLETYDEMLLVNDSCYLLRPLDEVFSQMDSRACDWWGLQASTRKHTARDPHREPISHESIGVLLDQVHPRQLDYLHVSSYFVAYRRPVIADREFQAFLGGITRQATKLRVILKYEIGLSRWLVAHGHPFGAFVEDVYPFHPLYSGWYFRLLDQGFPLLKRNLLSANPFLLENLANWKSRVLAKVPNANVDQFERNLQRVVPADELRQALHSDLAGERSASEVDPPESLVSTEEFRRLDWRVAKVAELWVFTADPVSGAFTGSARAIFEAVKDDSTILKHVVTRGEVLELGGVNVRTSEVSSVEAQASALQAGTILSNGDLHAELGFPVSGALHNIVDLGTSLPAAEALSQAMRSPSPRERQEIRAVVSSSRLDAVATPTTHYPLTFHQVWNTGLPKNDFLVAADDQLPDDLTAEAENLRRSLGGRQLVLMVGAVPPAAFLTSSAEELAEVARWLGENEFVLGLRLADSSKRHPILGLLSDEHVLDLSSSHYAHLEVLLRSAAVLVSDHYGVLTDFLLTGRPVVVHLSHHASNAALSGSSPESSFAFFGDLVHSISAIPEALESALSHGVGPKYELMRSLHHEHVDGRSAERVRERIRDLTEVHGVGMPFSERSA